MTAAAARTVRFDRYGGRDVLYVADIDMPSAGPGEVVVEARAAGINPGEAGIRVGAPTRSPNSSSDIPTAKSFCYRLIHNEVAGPTMPDSMTLMTTKTTATTK